MESRKMLLTNHSADNTLKALVAPESTPKMAVTMAKSMRSRTVMYASGGTDQPSMARQRDVRD